MAKRCHQSLQLGKYHHTSPQLGQLKSGLLGSERIGPMRYDRRSGSNLWVSIVLTSLHRPSHRSPTQRLPTIDTLSTRGEMMSPMRTDRLRSHLRLWSNQELKDIPAGPDHQSRPPVRGRCMDDNGLEGTEQCWDASLDFGDAAMKRNGPGMRTAWNFQRQAKRRNRSTTV